MATTIYKASAPDAPGRVLALRDAGEAEVLAREGLACQGRNAVIRRIAVP